MISKLQTQEYFKILSNIGDSLKQISDKELDPYLKNYVFKTKPFLHQKICFLLGIKQKGFLFFLDMGLGKTKILLDILVNRKLQGNLKKCLIIVPNEALMYSWENEIKIHTNNLTYTFLKGTKIQRLKNLNLEKNIYIINYAGLRVLFSDSVKTKNKSKNIINSQKIYELLTNFNTLILDESHYIKNPTSLTFKIVKEISNITYYNYGLTGTPMKSALDLWAQFYIIDKGLTLSNNFYIYKELYFNRVQTPFCIDWRLPKKNEKILHSRIKHSSIRFTEKEIESYKLPEQIFNTIHYDLSKEQKEYYLEAIKSFRDKEQSVIEIKNIFVTLRQMLSGYFSIQSDYSEEKEYFNFSKNPKLEILLEIIENISPNRKLVIFNDYIYTGNLLKTILSKKYKILRLYGGTKNKQEIISKFQNDKKYPILIANNQSGGIGLNLQVANYVIYYESPISPIIRKQSLKRCHRTGQTLPVYYYDLICKKSIEEKILESLKKDNDLFNAIINNKKNIDSLF